MDNQIRLRWTSHQGTVLSVFDALLAGESLVDVTLACEGQLIRAHKVILAACSPYFQELINVDLNKHPIIFLKDVKFSEIKALIQFMYRGEVNIGNDELQSILAVARALKIRGLAEVETDNNSISSDTLILPDLGYKNRSSQQPPPLQAPVPPPPIQAPLPPPSPPPPPPTVSKSVAKPTTVSKSDDKPPPAPRISAPPAKKRRYSKSKSPKPKKSILPSILPLMASARLFKRRPGRPKKSVLLPGGVSAPVFKKGRGRPPKRYLEVGVIAGPSVDSQSSATVPQQAALKPKSPSRLRNPSLSALTTPSRTVHFLQPMMTEGDETNEPPAVKIEGTTVVDVESDTDAWESTVTEADFLESMNDGENSEGEVCGNGTASATMFEFNERGSGRKPSLILDGFKYHKYRELESGRTYWSCACRGCKVRCATLKGNLKRVWGRHSHDKPNSVNAVEPQSSSRI